MTRIAIFGDSITHGHCDPVSGGWADMLKRDLWARDEDLTVYPLGISGDTTQMLLDRFDVEVKARHPNIIILAIGINDSIFFTNGGNSVDDADFEKKFRQLISKIEYTTKVFSVVGLTPVIDEMLQPLKWSTTGECYGTQRVLELDAIIQNICSDKNIKYIPVYDLLDKEDLLDGLHPNSTGHKKMFERIRDFLIDNVLESKLK